MLAQRLPSGSRVFVVGTEALAAEVVGAGLTLASGADDAEAVVQGHSPKTAWPRLAEACLAIRRGVPWLATNLDATLPTERGELPGNGSMVAALRTATGAEPEVAGKPGPSLLEEVIRRTAAATPLMVGDRVDSDIAAAHAADIPSLLVLTGVSDAYDVLTGPADQRPGYIAPDLRALFAEAAELRPGRGQLGRSRAPTASCCSPGRVTRMPRYARCARRTGRPVAAPSGSPRRTTAPPRP